MRCPTLKELPPPPAGKSGWPWTEESPQLPDTMEDGRPWPGISIITPSYNQGQFIEETIRGILLQGYPNLQYIIIDDCSTDNSGEIIRKYESWVTSYFHANNRGMSPTINEGFKMCTGDIIAWLASDDVYFPSAFREIGSRRLELKSCGAAVGSFQRSDANSKIEPIQYPPRLPCQGPLDLSLVSPPEEWRLHIAATFFMRQAIDEAGRFVREDLRYHMDRELLFRIAKKYKILLIDKTLVAFRKHSASQSWTLSKMIPFGLEFAKVEHLFFTDNNRDNLQRRKIARYIIAKGYIRYAKYNLNILKSITALLTALFYKPSFIVNKGYITIWLKTLHILPVLKWLKRVWPIMSDQSN